MEDLIDLHLHLDGSVPFNTVKKLSKLHHFPLISDDKLHQKLSVSDNCHNLNEYLEKFAFPLKLMQTKTDLELIVYELLRDLRKQGCIYVEMRFAPQLHTQKELTQEEAIRACEIGYKNFLNWQAVLRDGKPALHANFILCCMRLRGNEKENFETVELAHKLMPITHVVGIDLAGAETPEFAIHKYSKLFAKAKELGVPYTIHAGEAMGPNSIREALALGAKRIGHGIRCIEDQNLVNKLAKDKITLECCVTSNLNTKVFDRLTKYPVRELLHEDVHVTLNTDNMTVSHTNLPTEYRRLEVKTGLLASEEKEMLKNSIQASFASPKEKQRLTALLG